MDKLVKDEVLYIADDQDVKDGKANVGDVRDYKSVKYSVLYMKAIKALGIVTGKHIKLHL